MRLDDLFQNLGLGLPFLFGPRHSRSPETWDPPSPHSKAPLVWITNGESWFCRKQVKGALRPDGPFGC